MKKHYVILMLMVSSFTTSYSQATTYFGEGTGIAGLRGSLFWENSQEQPCGLMMICRNSDNSFFGDACGMVTTSTDNTGVGSKALLENTTGSGNVAVGASLDGT